MSNWYLLWSGFGAETKAAIIGAVSTIFVGFIGFGGLILQMRSQGAQSRGAVAENERRRLKAAMYEDAVLVCREVANASMELSNFLRMMILELELASIFHGEGKNFNTPKARYPDFIEKYHQFSKAVVKFIFLVEHRRVVDPKFLIFRTAMNVVIWDASKIIQSSNCVMTALPVQFPDGTIFPYAPPPFEHIPEIKNLCEKLIDSLGNADAYAEDFLVELQNALLGDLFGKRVAHRVPLDPAKKVITFEKADELERWFETSTDWGREMARIEAETAARFATEKVSL